MDFDQVTDVTTGWEICYPKDASFCALLDLVLSMRPRFDWSWIIRYLYPISYISTASGTTISNKYLTACSVVNGTMTMTMTSTTTTDHSHIPHAKLPQKPNTFVPVFYELTCPIPSFAIYLLRRSSPPWSTLRVGVEISGVQLYGLAQKLHCLNLVF